MSSSWLEEAESIARERDARIVAGPLVLPGSLTSLCVWTQRHLRAAAAPGTDVERLVQMAGPPRGERVLTCGRRGGPSFQRLDGVRCNFLINFREGGQSLELLSYVLHVDAPDARAEGPRFLRWEYSPSRKANLGAVREPLAHLHPGRDDLRLPAPVLGPKELIAVFLTLKL